MIIFRIIPLLTIFMVVLAPPQARAADTPSPMSKAVELQKIYEKMTSFSADFSQLSSMKLSRRQRHGSGTLLIKKPGLIRWDYQEPDHQVIISDGERISMYFAEAEQLIIMPAKEYLQSDVTYAFFAGQGDILRDFKAEAPGDDFCCGEPPDLKLIPKEPHPQVEYLYIWLNDYFLIGRMQIFDHYGSINDLSFTNLKFNPPVKADNFTFIPPEGTEIIEQ